MSTVVIALSLSTEENIHVALGSTTHINSNKTLKAISKALNQTGCWSGQHLSLKGKVRARGTSEDGSETSIEELQTTAEEFQSDGGSFVVHVADLTSNLSARVQTLSGQVSELRAALGQQQAEQRAKLDEVESRLTSRLAIVESEASEFRKVIFHYVIDEVHKRIQASLGTKAEDQLWDVYLGDKYSSQRAWFEERELGFAELALLSKGHNTRYQAGNDAVHRPQPAVVSRIVGEGSETWSRLWKVACS